MHQIVKMCFLIIELWWHFSLVLALLKVLDQNRQDVVSKHSTFRTKRMQFQQPCLSELHGLYVTPNRTADIFFEILLVTIQVRVKLLTSDCLRPFYIRRQQIKSMKMKMNLRALLFLSTTLCLPLLVVSWVTRRPELEPQTLSAVPSLTSSGILVKGLNLRGIEVLNL